MFHNMLMTGLTHVSSTNEIDSWENRPFLKIWPEAQQPKQRDIKTTITKKKLKRNRTSFTTSQLRGLEKIYSRQKYINSEDRRQLADCLKIGEKAIKVWFQNRRMKEKRESSDSSWDSSSDGVSTTTVRDASSQVTYETDSFENQNKGSLIYTKSPSPLHDVQSTAIQTQESSGNYIVGNHSVRSALPPKNYQVPESNPQNSKYFANENKEKAEHAQSYYYNSQIPNYFSQQMSNFTTSTAMPFAYDTNVYPTQYYPVESQYYSMDQGKNYEYSSSGIENTGFGNSAGYF